MTEVVGEQNRAVVSVDDLEALSDKPESFGRQAWYRFRRHKLAMVGIAVLSIITLSFIFVPIIVDTSPTATNVLRRNEGPSMDHPFGTDDLGRDLMIRTFLGGRVSLQIAFITAVAATTIGALLGALAGYLGRWVDTGVSQVVNLFLAIPVLPILLVFSIRFGAQPTSVAIMLAAFLWIRSARIVRGQFMQFKGMEFVQAARASGASSGRIIFRHIFPNTMGPILVEATLLAGTAIIFESTLSFLGLGVQPPETSLGVLVNEAKGFIQDRPTRIFLPGGFITLIVLSINFVGDGLRDALDPTSRDGH